MNLYSPSINGDRKRLVSWNLQDTSEKLKAYTYVWGNRSDPNLYGDWDFEEWRRLHMNDFIKMTNGFMEELELPESKTRVATYESFYQHEDDSSPIS